MGCSDDEVSNIPPLIQITPIFADSMSLPYTTVSPKPSLPCFLDSPLQCCLPPHGLCMRHNPARPHPSCVPAPPCSTTCSGLLFLRVSCSKPVIISSATDIAALKRTTSSQPNGYSYDWQQQHASVTLALHWSFCVISNVTIFTAQCYSWEDCHDIW